MGIKLKNTLSSALSAANGQKLGSISFLGSGGPMDVDEGTMSALLQLDGGRKVLIDCGPTVFSSLMKQGSCDGISMVILTSSHESSLGSLSSLVTYLTRNKGSVNIACSSAFAPSAVEYLTEICGVSYEKFVMCTVAGDGDNAYYTDSFKEDGMEVTFMGNSFLMDIGQIRLLHSGVTDIPVFDRLDEQTMTSMRKSAENVIVLHHVDDHVPELLSEWSNVFKNFFIFGHDEKTGKKIIFNERYMRSLSTNGANNEFIIEKQFSI